MATRYGGNREVAPDLQRRIAVATAVVLLAFSVVCARLWYLQLQRGADMRLRSENNRVRPVRIPAARGVVYDRHGEILVDNRPSFNAIFVPEDAKDRRQVLRNVSLYLNEPEEELLERIRAPGKRPPYEGLALRRDVDWQGVVALETHQLEIPGVTLQVVPKRYYPFGPLAAHLLGYVGEVSERDLAADAGGGSCGYRQGDLGGKAGLERALDDELCGRAGVQRVEVDAHGRRMRVLEELADRSGSNVTLTIDRDLQETAERALGEYDGSIVALDPRNGEVLVMASRPAFDPNVFARGIRRDEWRALIQDEKHPLTNRAIQGQYPPGSTFKMVVAAGALERHLVGPGTGFGCGGGLQFGGHYFRCWRKGGHGAIALHQALVQSCDVYFYQVGQRLGVDGIAEYARRFGLGLPTGIRLPHEKAGIIPDTAWKQRRFKQPWFAGETLSVAIGQGYVTTTPLQLAQFAAMLGNGGIRYRPQYVKRIEAPDGTVVHEMQPEIVGKAGLDPATVARIKEAMRDVVMTERGTGKNARVPGVEVAGKTGTAQSVGERDRGTRDTRTRKDHAWFIAFAPVDEPEIAIAVLAEHAGHHGGTVAAPMAQQVLERYFTRGAPTVPLPPRETPAPTTEAHATRPSSHHPL